ncbi:MAG: VCBS repeat-containing protein, partial [Planctomycetes bacterium]|nr:VCBS repeat-containing protein [Planctomycetota bacterium]
LLRRETDAGAFSSPQAILAADIDGDGLLDIVSAESGDAAVAVYRRDRAGDFTAGADEIAGAALLSRPSALAAADFDADGRLDVATLSIDADADPAEVNAVILYQRAGGETESRVVDLPGGAGAGDVPTPLALAAADMDGDGRADLAVADVDSGAIHVLLQDDAGGFGARVTTLTQDGLQGPETLALADLDGDGRTDIITAGRTSDAVIWFRQLAGGAYAAAATLEPETSVVLDGPISVLACDLNRDGRLDVVAAGHVSANLVVFYQQEAGTFAMGVEIPLPEGPSGMSPVQVVACDLDGDGDLDLAVAGLGSPSLLTVIQTASAVFDVQAVTEGLDGSIATALAAADLDGDGRVEIVLADAYQHDPSVHIVRIGAQGEAAEVRTLRSDLISAPAGILVFDLDGDGEMDIATANRASDNVTVLRGGR